MEGAAPPLDDLEPVFQENTVQERLYQVVLTLREPTDVETVSMRAECPPDAAQEYLDFLEEFDIVIKHPGPPEQFKRNEEFFEWRYVTHLANTNSVEDLQETIRELDSRATDLQYQYEVEETELDLSYLRDHPYLDSDTVWNDLTTWINSSEEIRLYRHALQRLRNRRRAQT